MAKKPKSIQSFIMPHLRRASRYWPPKLEARKKAKRKVQIGTFKNGKAKYEDRYVCHVCKNLFTREQSQVDHLVEVAAIGQFDSWDATVSRLFCAEEGFGVKCVNCHTSKTAKNQILRRIAKKQAKKTPLEKFQEYEQKSKKQPKSK